MKTKDSDSEKLVSMSKLEMQKYKNGILRKLDRQSRFPLNCVKFGAAESREHATKKFKYVLDFKGNTDFLTEICDSGKKHRADILFFTVPRATIIEIKYSKSEESLKAKKTFWESNGFKFLVI